MIALPLDLFTVKLLKFIVPVPLIVWSAEPLNVTVPVPPCIVPSFVMLPVIEVFVEPRSKEPP